jgi:hypothetical protein
MDDDSTVLIIWDNITVRLMGMNVAIRCGDENPNWALMPLKTADIEKIANRDAEADVRLAAGVLEIAIIDDPRLDAESLL